MLGIGKQVLQKIQNLLVEIDKPETNRTKKGKSQDKNKTKKQAKQSNYDQAHRKRKNSDYLGKQNVPSERIQQLYLNHFVKQDKRLIKKVQNLEQQLRNVKQFKVQSKISQFLNKKQNLRPIYQRTTDILLKKQKSKQKIRQKAPKNKQEIQHEQMQRIQQENHKKYRKLTKQEFQNKMQQIQTRKVTRMQKIQREKLFILQQKCKALLQKPQLTENTNQWWQKKKLKKNLSNNVFERFQQYGYERKQNWEKYLEKRKQQETPFVPKISEATRQIASRSKIKRSIYQKMSRSHSCRTLSKQQEPSFIQKKDQSFADRSVMKNTKHEKSTTVNSSRNHMMSSQNVFLNEKRLF